MLPPVRTRDASADEVDAAVRRATAERRPKAWRRGAVLVAAGIALASIVATTWPRSTERWQVVTDEHPAKVEGVGDVSIALAPRSEVDLEESTERRVAYRLRRGVATFHVVPRREGEEVLVRVRDLEVHVVGTVFTVHAGADRASASVEVLEGTVAIVSSSGRRLVSAGGVFRAVDDASAPPQAEAVIDTGAANISSEQEPVEVPAQRSDAAPARPSPAAHQPAQTGDTVGAPTAPSAPQPKPPVIGPSRSSGASAPANARSTSVETATRGALHWFKEATDRRAAGDVEGARNAFGRARRAAGGTPLAALSAYEEGRLLADVLGRPHEALAAWRAALLAKPPASISEGLLSRLALTAAAVGDVSACRRHVASYLAAHPTGADRERVEGACP